MRSAGGPVLGAVDGCEALAVAGVGVGAGVEEEDGDVGEPRVGGDVERGAFLSVDVADGFRVRDEGGAHSARGVPDGAVEDTLAAGVEGDGRCRRNSGAKRWRRRAGGCAVHGGDGSAGGGIPRGDGCAGISGGGEGGACHDDGGDAGVFVAELEGRGPVEVVDGGEHSDGAVVGARRDGSGDIDDGDFGGPRGRREMWAVGSGRW